MAEKKTFSSTQLRERTKTTYLRNKTQKCIRSFTLKHFQRTWEEVRSCCIIWSGNANGVKVGENSRIEKNAAGNINKDAANLRDLLLTEQNE